MQYFKSSLLVLAASLIAFSPNADAKKDKDGGSDLVCPATTEATGIQQIDDYFGKLDDMNATIGDVKAALDNVNNKLIGISGLGEGAGMDAAVDGIRSKIEGGDSSMKGSLNEVKTGAQEVVEKAKALSDLVPQAQELVTGVAAATKGVDAKELMAQAGTVKNNTKALKTTVQCLTSIPNDAAALVGTVKDLTGGGE